MIEGIKIAVTSYKDSEESANLAAQISFFIAKKEKPGISDRKYGIRPDRQDAR